MDTLAAKIPSRVALSVTCSLSAKVVGVGGDDGPVGVWPPQARSMLISVIMAPCFSVNDEDAADSSCTVHVLTVMLSQEYSCKMGEAPYSDLWTGICGKVNEAEA